MDGLESDGLDRFLVLWICVGYPGKVRRLLDIRKGAEAKIAVA